jgi:hypothetical protein
MWYTTLIILFFHHIVIFFQRIGLLFVLSMMKNTKIVWLKGSMLSSSVKGTTPDLGVLRGSTLIFYKFLTYPKRYSMLWFKKHDELLVIRKYYLLGYPRSISPDQKKLPFTYDKALFHEKISKSLQANSITIEYRFVFTPNHLGVKLDDTLVGDHDIVFDHMSLINHKSIIAELNDMEPSVMIDINLVKQALKLSNQ